MAATAPASETEEMAEVTAPENAPESNGSAPADPNAMVNFAFRIPSALKEAIDAKGKEGGVTGNEWARQYVAHAFDFVLPPARVRAAKTAKYAGLSKEEKAERVKQDRIVRNALAKALLAQFEQGSIRLDEGSLVVDGQPLDMDAIKAAIS